MKYDVLIIGSGLGGLLCGYILSKEGYKVCIVEQGSQIGGCLQTFTRNNCVFDTGVHYVGGLDKNQNLFQYFKYFGLMNNTKILKMDETGFDRICFSDDPNEYKYAMGHERFIETLAQVFPKERAALGTYCDKLAEICHNFPLYNLEVKPINSLEMGYFNDNAFEFINSITTNQKLRAVLAGSNPLYCGVKSQTPLYVHALTVNSFIQSAWRFVNGGNQIALSLSKSIKEFGGEIFTNHKVTKLVGKEKRITEVEISNSDNIEADHIISDIHPQNTIRLLDGINTKTPYFDRLMSIENTGSVFVVYACLKKNSVKFMNHNYYYYRDTDIWDSVKYTDSDWPKGCFITTPVVTGTDTYAESLIVLSYMNYAEVKEWENLPVNNRGEKYDKFKQRKAEQVVGFIEKKLPGIRDNIRSYYTSSPLTLKDYTGTVNGSLYGILKDCNNPMRTLIMPKTKVSNLFFTGQNVIMHGVLGVTISAVLTCSELVGKEYLVNKIKNV
jgi:all-trans-retinol 13,14-reductase